MPIAPPRVCRGAGCRATTTAPDGFCDVHRRAWRQRQDATRGSASARGYGHDWQAIRARILKRDPICGELGCTARSSQVDHIIPKSRGGSDQDSNLRGMCRRHHSRKTVLADGGFGRGRS